MKSFLKGAQPESTNIVMGRRSGFPPRRVPAVAARKAPRNPVLATPGEQTRLKTLVL